MDVNELHSWYNEGTVSLVNKWMGAKEMDFEYGCTNWHHKARIGVVLIIVTTYVYQISPIFDFLRNLDYDHYICVAI